MTGKRIRKGWPVLALALAVVFAFSGCGPILYGEKLSDEEMQQSTSQEISGKLTLNGSTSMAKVSQALGEAFSAKHGKATVETSGTGSGDAPNSVISGNALIGNMSRDMKDSENPDQFEQVQIAIDGIVITVNKANPVTNLTTEQVTKIFSGEIKNWKEVGGNDQEITLLGRESSSGTRDGFESLFDVEGCEYAAELTSTGEVVTRVSSDPSSIGYISLDSLNDSMVGLKIDGAEPSEENILNGTYLVQRPFIQVYKKGSDSELIETWFQFVKSEEGQKIIQESGLIPVAE